MNINAAHTNTTDQLNKNYARIYRHILLLKTCKSIDLTAKWYSNAQEAKFMCNIILVHHRHINHQ